MKGISEEEINRIRSNVDIVDVISSYIPLVSKGKNFFGVCPFHDDKHPSMSVSKEKQIYTCFSCGATGNVFKFLMDYENISFVEAVKRLADKAGIPLNVPVFGKFKEKNKEFYEVYEIAEKFYQNNINTKAGIDAKEYLKNRDIDEKLIKEFGIGLALKERNFLSKILLKKEINENLLLKSGLLLKNDFGYSDMYVNRIMFPLHDLSGKVIGFSGRVYHGETDSKYINTRETEIFKKGEILYNYHRAKDIARKKNQVLIMEGFMDVIRAYTIGVENVVASMGTAITSNHALLLKRMAKEIILCFDGDKAGEKATVSCIAELDKVGVIPKVIRLEDNLDPDEYIKKYGKERFLEKIENPMSVMDFKLNHYKQSKNLSDSKDLADYVNQIIEDLSQIEDEVLKEITLKKVSEETSLDFEFLKNRVRNKIEKPVEVLQQKPKKAQNKYIKAEQALLYYMLKSKEVIAMYNKKITRMSVKAYQDLGTEISLFYKKYGTINEADFMTFVEYKEEYMKTLEEILKLQLKEDYTLEEIDDYLNVIREYNVNEEISRLQQKMKQATSKQEKLKYAQMMIELKKGESKND